MKKASVVVVAVLLMASVVSAASTVWNPAANPLNQSPWNLDVNAWTSVDNWTNGLPTAAVKGVFNVGGAIGAVVTTDVSGFQLVMGDGGTTNGNTLHVANGGTVTTKAAWSGIGYNREANVVVHKGGTFNFGQHAWIGQNTDGLGTVDILGGGLVTVAGMLGLGWNGGTGFVNVENGGVMDLFQLHGDGSTSIKNGSLLNIVGVERLDSGYVLLPGDYSAVVQAYIDNGLIIGNGGVDGVDYDFGITTPGKTTVFVPEPATMILLGLGGLVLRRRRK